MSNAVAAGTLYSHSGVQAQGKGLSSVSILLKIPSAGPKVLPESETPLMAIPCNVTLNQQITFVGVPPPPFPVDFGPGRIQVVIQTDARCTLTRRRLRLENFLHQEREIAATD